MMRSGRRVPSGFVLCTRARQGGRGTACCGCAWGRESEGRRALPAHKTRKGSRQEACSELTPDKARRSRGGMLRMRMGQGVGGMKCPACTLGKEGKGMHALGARRQGGIGTLEFA